MAELLVRAKGHWMDAWDANKIASLDTHELENYNSRSQLGDIIVVRPDGWEWGGSECLPDFIVVKLNEVSEEDAKIYEKSLMDTTDPEKPKMLKRRKYKVPSDTIQTQIDANETVLDIPAGKGDGTDPVADFIDTIVEKTS